MDNDFDILQKKWKAVDCSATSEDHGELLDNIRSQRSRSLNQKIERSYRMPMIVGLLLPAIAGTLLDVVEASTLLRIIYGAFGLIMAFGCVIMIKNLRACDYSQMTVRQAVATVHKLFRYHVVLLCIGWILCLPVLALFFYELNILDDIYLMWGAIAGVVIGFAISIPREVRIYRNFRTLQHIFDENVE